MGYLIMLYNRFHYSVISVMLPIRNGSSFSLLQQRLRGLIGYNFATKIRFLSEKAKSFSIFLQITEVLQMEIGAQKKRDEAKSTLLHLFLYNLIFSILLHIVNHLHELLAQFISLLHGRGLAIYADDRLGITLAEMNPLVREIELDAIDICYGDILLLTIHLLNLHEDSIYIGRWSQVDAVLGDEIVREAGTELAHLAALVSQTAQEEGDTNEGITTVMALWIDNSTIAFTTDNSVNILHLGSYIHLAYG